MSDKTGKAERPEPSFLRSVNLAEVGLSRGEANRAARRRGEPRKKENASYGPERRKTGPDDVCPNLSKSAFYPAKQRGKRSGEKRRGKAENRGESLSKKLALSTAGLFFGCFFGEKVIFRLCLFVSA